MTPESDFLTRAESGCGNYAIAFALLRVAAAIERLGTANETADAFNADAIKSRAETSNAIARAIAGIEAKMRDESEP